ncbi:MAG TPA: macro domain-containing protein [Candidatus Limnocylindrales bacterium]|jgi:O-acetyl-ADP-ribose deacetylase (regulator of RNase III)
MKLEVVIGDITSAKVEAIVNAANSELWMGGGVAGAIKRAAGDSVEKEAMALGPISPGESVVTSAGALPAPIKWVVHAATMGPDLLTSESLIREATTSALAEGARIGATSMAYPALGTGVGGFRMDQAAEVMVGAVLAGDGGPVEMVLFVVRDFPAMQEFASAIGRRR